MSGAVTPDYEQEIRFAVVLYGGASLCIYINGIAQELLHMVRGTADLPPEEKLSEVEKVYRELGQRIGRNDFLPIGVSVKSDDPIRSRFVVDIISGTSAGGINGVALAKALALKCKDLSALRKTWMDEAQIDALLNDDESDFRTYPPGPKRASLLNSDRMYGKILETLDKMNSSENRTPDCGDFADKIDLFVTATDLTGLDAPIQLTGQKVGERVHRTVFHFECPSPKTDELKNEFEYEYDPMLAFAARCTSSFPVAFEPMRFDRIEKQIDYQRNLSLKDAKKQFERFFPEYRGLEGVQFWTRQFADGGYLDNRPFSYVTDVIQYRSATRHAKRKLLFVDPFPELQRKRSKSETEHEINFVENAVLAATTLPRYEVIRGDIQKVTFYNHRLERLEALRTRDERDRRELGIKTATRCLSADEFANSSLETLVREYGQGFPRYHHLRIYDTSDLLAQILTRMAGFEMDSDEFVFVRRLQRAWRDEHYDAYDKNYDAYTPDNKSRNVKKYEGAFLVDFDVDYRMRRLNLLRVRIDEKQCEQKLPSRRGKKSAVETTLQELRASTETQLKRLRDTMRELGNPKGPFLENEQSRNLVGTLTERLTDCFDEVMEKTTIESRDKAARETYWKLHEDIDALMDRLRDFLNDVFTKNREEMESLLPYDSKQLKFSELEDLHDTFYLFHWHDFLSLPFLEGSGAKEHAEIEVYRVSPADSELKPAYMRDGAEKLTGTSLWAFGAFLEREWRAHDMMWGRLDAAERIITALVPVTDKPKVDAEIRNKFISKAQDEILREEFSLESDSQDRIFLWLAQKLRERKATSASVEDLKNSGEHLLKMFPTLNEVICKQEFKTFLLTHYSPAPSPEPERVANWTGRSLDILGRMIDDLPNGKLDRGRQRLARASRTGSVLLTNLLRFATPGSVGKTFADHILALAVMAALLLLFVGPLAGVDGVAMVGFAALAGCVIYWWISHSFSRWLKGKQVVYSPAGAVVGLMLILLVVIGAMAAWQKIHGFTELKSLGETAKQAAASVYSLF